MSISNILHRQYVALIHHWPIDPLRPTISFRETLSARVNQYFGTHVEADATIPSQNTPAITPASSAEGKPVVKFDANTVQKEIDILGNLLEDRFKKAYPLKENMLRPKSNPEYYEKLLKELDAAPERSWLESKLNFWKGVIRFQ
ncbi:hypothetical protein BDD12DRAFT_852447 [Trichophaea hybrida]|nr:hypothetical protein BDD12DRAFT_852447 [Trichophaea hybrida]